MKIPFYLLLTIIVFSCAKKVVPGVEKKQDNVTYSEDLSEFRAVLNDENLTANPLPVSNSQSPVTTTEPMYINDKVDAILGQKAAKNRSIKYANGYRIQIYVGRERQTVDNAKVYMYQNFPNLNPYLSYSLPIYKLKVGDFLTKSDADRVFAQIKDLYPDAIILSEKIDVKKSFLKE
jgi:hypothetical protein